MHLKVFDWQTARREETSQTGTRLTVENTVQLGLSGDKQSIVELFAQCEINGHVALFMAKAGADTKSGTYTLAERIREEGRLSLDLLQRFGDELLSVLGWLEAKGISHRDIKPDNMGVAGTKADKALTLLLFDFSLADTPLENIQAGTPPYLDPFLRLSKPPRWDTYAGYRRGDAAVCFSAKGRRKAGSQPSRHTGPRSLTVKQIQQRIGSRYPEAEPIPGPPALDRLLAEAGIELVWDGANQSYSPKPHRPSYLSTTSTLHRMETASLAGEAATPELEEAWVLEERIQKAVSQHGFLVLSVAPKHAARAEQELLRRFQMQRMSVESILIGQMKSLAEQAGASWEVVLRADSAEPGSKDWRNLLTLVRRAVPGVEGALLQSDKTALVVNAGLLARYDQLGMLDRLRDAAERQPDTPGFIVLLPADRQTDMPVVDGTPLPVVLASQWARLTDVWISNSHRASQAVV